MLNYLNDRTGLMADDTELFTRLVADAGFPHLCKDISIGQNAASFIDWSATEEKE